MDFQSLVLFCFFFPVPATSLLFPLHSHWHSSDGYQTMSSRRHIPLLCCHSAHPQTHLPSNQWPCSTAGTHKQNRYKPLVNNQTNSWTLMRMKKKTMTYSISQTHCRFLHICVDQYRWKSNRVAPAVHLLPGVCGGPPLKLCLLKTLALHSHALLYGHTSVGQIRALLSLSAWRGGGSKDQRVLPAGSPI